MLQMSSLKRTKLHNTGESSWIRSMSVMIPGCRWVLDSFLIRFIRLNPLSHSAVATWMVISRTTSSRTLGQVVEKRPLIWAQVSGCQFDFRQSWTLSRRHYGSTSAGSAPARSRGTMKFSLAGHDRRLNRPDTFTTTSHASTKRFSMAANKRQQSDWVKAWSVSCQCYAMMEISCWFKPGP